MRRVFLCLALALLACSHHEPAPPPPVPPPAPPSPAPPAAPEETFGAVVSMAALDDIVHATGITTAILGARSKDAVDELPEGVRIETHCRGEHGCLDVLAAGAHVLIPLEEEHAWRERVIRVPWQDASVISAYVAESEYSGGAHSNNHFMCRTFDAKTGRALRLRDVLPPASAARIQRKVQALLDSPEHGFDVVRAEVPRAYTLDERGFRFGRDAAPRTWAPDLILCAEAAGIPWETTILEIPLDDLPVRWLLSD